MKAVAKTVEPAEREARFDHIRPLYLEALTLGRAAASPAARRHQGRVRPPRPRRHQFGAGAAALQYRRQGADRRRAAHARLLSRLQRLLQSEEARRDGLPRSPALARRSPFGAHQADRQGPRRARHRRARSIRSTCARSSRSAASMPTSSPRSTRRCTGSSASGPTRSSIASKIRFWLRRARNPGRNGRGFSFAVGSKAPGP